MAIYINDVLVAGTDAIVRVSDSAMVRHAWTSSAAPSGLTYGRTGTWNLIDDVAQSHLVAFGANVWSKEKRADGSLWLPVRAAYTNQVTAPRDVTGTDWQAGTADVTANAAAGPDDTAAIADRVNCDSGEFGPYFNKDVYTGTNTYTFSVWQRTVSGAGEYNAYFAPDVAGGEIVAVGAALTTVWKRIAITLASTAGGTIAAEPLTGTDLAGLGGLGAGARDNYLDCVQVTQSGIVLPFSTGAVGASVLARPGAELVASNGRFDVTLTSGSLRAAEAATAPAANQYLVYIDANNHLMLRASDRKFVLTLGGAVVGATAAKNYAADHDLGHVRVWSRSDGCGFQIDGGEVTAAAQAAVSVPSTAYLLSNNGSNVFQADVRLDAGDLFIARHAV